MKIFFVPPASDWSIESGYRQQWEETVKRFPQSGNDYIIVDDDSQADFIILGTQEETIHKGISKLIRPLSRKDVETFTWDPSDRPTGRLSGFYCSLPKYLFDERRHSSFCYPVGYNELIDEFPRHEASLDFSFLGSMMSTLRVKLVDHFRESEHKNNSIVRATEGMPWAWSDAIRARPEIKNKKQVYVDLLRRSKFILCPKGYGTGTFRMFEAMQAGRVPVIISDAYVKPAGIDWDSCSLTIPERRIADIPAIIQSRMDDWDALAANARAVWETNFSPQHIMNFIATNLLRMSEAVQRNGFSSWGHSARVGSAVFQEHARPLAGRVKQSMKSMIPRP